MKGAFLVAGGLEGGDLGGEFGVAAFAAGEFGEAFAQGGEVDGQAGEGGEGGGFEEARRGEGGEVALGVFFGRGALGLGDVVEGEAGVVALVEDGGDEGGDVLGGGLQAVPAEVEA